MRNGRRLVIDAHPYCALALEDMAPADAAAWLEQRPTFGIGLPGELLESCELGGLYGEGVELLEAAREVDVPPVGSRLVVGRVETAAVAATAWLELRARGAEAEGRGRLREFSRALRRARDLCLALRGSDPSILDDKAAELVRAVVCRLAHDRRLPLRCRVDRTCEYLTSGTFTGVDRATVRMRRRLDSLLERASARHEVAARTPAAVREGLPRVPSATQDPPKGAGPAIRPLPDLRALVTADANLYAAWERVRDNARSAGRWTDGLVRFEDSLGDRLRELQEQLRAGAWTPAPARHVTIPKPSGSRRHLHVPPPADRVVEGAIARVLSELLDPHLSPWSFAFRPGRGVVDAIRVLAALRDDGATHVARFDLANCFGSVDHSRLRAALTAYIDDEWLLGVVDQILVRDLPGLPRTSKMVGIAQGSPLSPLLANLLLDELDRALADADYPAVRYADDVALAASSRRDAEEGLDRAIELAADLGFEVRAAKTAVTSFIEVVEFLGERIGPDAPASEDGGDGPPPAKRTLYLTTRTSHVQLRRGQVRALTRDGTEVLSVPVSAVERIVVMGPASIAAGLRSHALYRGVEVVFLSRSGSWLGRYDRGLEVDPALRRRQYALLDERATAVRIGGAMAAGKVANQRALLLRYGRRETAIDNAPTIVALETLARQVASADTPAAVMGLEGAATKHYHPALAALFPQAAGFTRRTKRPPRDPANAALSFGYALLTGEAHAACVTAGLDPQVGLLHASARRRPALALDLVEEFRPLLIDSLVLTLFRRHRLRHEHFRHRSDGAVLLNDAGRKVFIDAYETRLLSRFRSQRSKARVTYRDGVREQARLLADVLRGDEVTYRPVLWR